MDRRPDNSRKPNNRNNRRPNNNNKSKTLSATVQEDVRIAIEQRIDTFMQNESQTQLEFPMSFTNIERAFVHSYAPQYGLKTKSHGQGDKRTLSVYKRDCNTYTNENSSFDLSLDTRKIIFKVLKEFPSKDFEKLQLQAYTQNTRTSFRMNSSFPINRVLTVPPLNVNETVKKERQNLPIYSHRNEIIHMINNNEVVLISGSTGSGKTTQVPQFIMEEFCDLKKPCRIICTQPRRLSAISVAERVSYERGERIGESIGYQIRLESMLSPSSNLIYCTNGILLRSLIGEENSSKSASLMNEVTHIIVDEVHERDKLCDFLLITLRERKINNVGRFKLILMSATLDTDVFQTYFNMCPVMHIEGKNYEVQLKYLDEVLYDINYKNRNSEVINHDVGDVMTRMANMTTNASDAENSMILDDEIKTQLNILYDELLNKSNEENFKQICYLIATNYIPIDYKAGSYGFTPLMILAGKGQYLEVECLMKMGANPMAVGAQGLTAFNLAVSGGHQQIAEYLKTRMDSRAGVVNESTMKLMNRYKYLLDTYLSQTNEMDIDHQLLFETIRHIHMKKPSGAILVFLPGYDDILQQNDLLVNQLQRHSDVAIRIFLLHSNMQTNDQKEVFKPYSGRKIILSTNIAETSITIDDVVYVIDTGKVKQKSYDSISGASCLQLTWIAQSCAIQRSGRAGRIRPGVCYRMYSSTRYESMDKYTVAELLRSSLTEICLHAKLLTNGDSIIEFLSKAIQPPLPHNIKQSINNLITIDALDHNENITELGLFLSDLPVDVRLGKILIYGIMFKCLDPVLTIISCLSVNDPFVLPASGDSRRDAFNIKRELSEGSFSDYLTLLKVFQKWNEAKSCGEERAFCARHYISTGTMTVISGLRTQLLQHLRSCNLIKINGSGNLRDLNSHSNNWALVKGCLAAGLYPNIVRIDRGDNKIKSRLNEKIDFHQSSVLYTKTSHDKQEMLDRLTSEWIIYEEKTLTGAGRISAIKCNSVVTPITVALFCGSSVMHETNLIPTGKFLETDDYESNAVNTENIDPEEEVTKFLIDDWISFLLKNETAYFVYHLRKKINHFFVKILRNPDKLYRSDVATVIIEAVARIIAHEDTIYNMPKHLGIGTIPKTINIEHGEPSNYNRNNNKHNNSTDKRNGQYQGYQRKNNQSAMTSRTVPPIENNGINTNVARYTGTRPKINSSNQLQNTVMNGHQNYEMDNKFKELNTDATEVKFSPFMNHIQAMKYFVVEATSVEQIKCASIGNGTVNWTFAPSTYSFLKQMLKDNRNLNIIIFFLLKNQSSFYGTAKFVSLTHEYFMLSDKFMTFDDMQGILNKEGVSVEVHEFCDGAEIPPNIGQIIYNNMSW